MRNLRVLLFASAVGWAQLAACTPDPTPAEPVIRPVRYEEVVASGEGRVRRFSGSARAGVESHLSFRVAGSIRNLRVRVGDSVSAGQLLAELDPKDYELQVQEVEASRAQAQAASRNAAANYERVRALYENDNVSLNDLDAARAGAEGAAASVDSLDKRLELAELQLSYTRLAAPVDGAIAAVGPEVNEIVGIGEPVFQITSGSLAEVEVAMPEVLISGVRQGDAVNIRFSALPRRDFTATVTKVGVSSIGAATTFPVTVRLDVADRDVRPGMAADVAFRFESGRDGELRIVVPPHAVGEDRLGRFVFVLEGDVADEARLAVARRRAVEVGELSERGLEVVSGLAPGELLVTAGVRRLSDGQTVRVPAL